MNKFATTKQTRKRLLATVSAFALLASIAVADPALADGTDKPQLWIELGGGFDQMNNAQSTYTPPFMGAPQSLRDFSIPDTEKPTHSALDFDGKITFQPENSDWVMSAEIRYGRSQKRGDLMHAQPKAACHYYTFYHASLCTTDYAFADAVSPNSETHAILDFKAGRDVGLGSIKDGTSVISAGLRYAQFRSDMTAQMSSQPQNYRRANAFAASLTASRSFTGIGPEISWDASAPLVGNPGAGMLSLDWGANAALLFGRQKAKVHHETLETRYTSSANPVLYDNATSPARARSVTVPNLGGFAGISVRYSVAKFSVGYRADMFFGAVDAGIDTRKTYDRGFYGPFASVSVGIGG